MPTIIEARVLIFIFSDACKSQKACLEIVNYLFLIHRKYGVHEPMILSPRRKKTIDEKTRVSSGFFLGEFSDVFKK